MKKHTISFPILFPSIFRIKHRCKNKTRYKFLKTKICVALILLLICSAGVGVSYSSFNGNFITNSDGSCWCDVQFIGVSASDNENEKFIGDVSAVIVEGGKKIQVDITHAYPCYKVFLVFEIQNTGDNPISADGIVVKTFDETAMNIDIVWNNWLDVLLPGDIVEGEMTLTVLNTVEQNSMYPFTIGFGFSSEECDDCV